MVERNDPGRAGVIAGRVVGAVTAALAVATLFWYQDSFYAVVDVLLAPFELPVPAPWVFWANVVVAATTRYAVCYVVGSLIGVAYDWLDRPGWPTVLGLALLVGLGDGLLAVGSSPGPLLALGYGVAWLGYVPAFVWLYDPDAGDARGGSRRLS